MDKDISGFVFDPASGVWFVYIQGQYHCTATSKAEAIALLDEHEILASFA